MESSYLFRNGIKQNNLFKNALKNTHAIQFKPIKIENTFKYFFSDFGWTPNAKMVCCT